MSPHAFSVVVHLIPKSIENFLAEHSHGQGAAHIVMLDWKIGKIKYKRRGQQIVGYLMASCLKCLVSKIYWELEDATMETDDAQLS